MSDRIRYRLVAGISFIIPVIVVLSNAGYFTGFADSAEFALVSSLNGIAHPPGFPAYILLSHFWNLLLSAAGISPITSLIWFSATCTALATLLLFFSMTKLITYIYNLSAASVQIISLFCSLSFITGATAWHWSGNIEVYAFQVLTFALLWYGIIFYRITQQRIYILITTFGCACGLANHHLTMILFLPFLLFFLLKPFQVAAINTAKKSQQRQLKLPALPLKIVVELAALTLLFTSLFYGWLYWRASESIIYKFGNPDTFERLFYHISGGAWIKNTQAEVKGIAALRFPYFMSITFRQLLFFIPLFIAGIIELLKRKLFPLLIMITGYYLLVLCYQLRIDQTADTDAYLLPSFYMLCIIVSFGAVYFYRLKKSFIYIFPALFLLQYIINFDLTDKRKFDVGETLMKELDRSSPANSVILIADWTTVIQYYYYRIHDNFRPDLVVLNYDLKFTNFKNLPLTYPAFYKEIQPDYDLFIKLLARAHPQEIYNTGCSLDNKELMDAYLNTVKRIQDYCNKNNYPFMCDPKAYLFLLQYGLMKNNAVVSGPFVSDKPTGRGEEFLNLNYDWLKTTLLLHEPSATDKLVDMEAALDFNRNYFKGKGNAIMYAKADSAYLKVKSLQRKIKKNVPFVYRRS
jgi:hypothetical protein